LLLAAIAAVGIAREPQPTLIERAEFRNANYFRLMRTFPSGKELGNLFGTRTVIGVESRALSKYGVGVSAAAEIWWVANDSNVTTFIPLSAGLLYARPFFDGAVVPYAGVFASYNFASLRYASGDSVASGAGSGPGGGASLGVEFPLFEKYRFKVESRVCLCGIPLASNGSTRQVSFSSVNLGIGLSMGLTDVCLW